MMTFNLIPLAGKNQGAFLLRLCAAALLHFGLIVLTFQVLTPQHGYPLIWIPSGVGLAMILIGGRKYWPAIFAGTCSAYLVVLQWPLLPSLAVAMACNTLEPILASAMLNRISCQGNCFSISIRQPRDFICLSTAIIISASLAVSAGIGSLMLTGIYSQITSIEALLHWWMCHVLGMGVFTPLILAWRRAPAEWLNAPKILETMLYFGLAFLAGQVLFVDWFHPVFEDVAYSFWMYIFVIWGALRFGLRGTMVVVAMTTIQSSIGITTGHGLFINTHPSSYLLNFWFFILVMTALAIVLSRAIKNLNDTQQQLGDHDKRWKLALESAGDGVWDWRLSDNTITFSPQWKSMLGYADNEITNSFHEFESRIHPEDHPSVLANVNRYLAGDQPDYAAEFRMRCKDGTWKWVLTRGMVVSVDRHGKPERFVGTHTDISRHRVLEEALRVNEEILMTVFSQTPSGMVVFDAEKNISHVNDAFCAMTGIQRERLIGLSENQFDQLMTSLCGHDSIYPATAGRGPQESVTFSFPHKPPRRRMSDREEQIRIGENQIKTLMRIVINTNNQRVSHLMMFRDISAESMVDRMKSEFLSTAAHELRTPIAIIMGYAELLETRTYDREQQMQMIRTIHNQSESITNLLNELLDLARIEARAGKAFNMKYMDPAPIIRELAESFMMAGDPRKVAVGTIPPLPMTMMDAEKIGQALKNCLSNAFKFSPKDTPVSLEVSLHARENHQEIDIIIRDRGMGMSPEQLSRVFEKFYRADTSGHIPGTGLGMSLIKEIVEHHGGSIDLDSAPGQGTTVTLRFPVRQDTGAAPTAD